MGSGRRNYWGERGGRRWLKYEVKEHGSTVEGQWKRENGSVEVYRGKKGVGESCVEVGRRSRGEGERERGREREREREREKEREK